MASKTVTLKLNQQQLEMIDNTLAKGEGNDRAALVRRALNEFVREHHAELAGKSGS